MQKFAEKLKNIKASLQSNESGFTLIELIVVMAILAVLVLLAAPQFLGYTKDAAATSLRQDAKIAEDAAFLYNIDTEGWPITEESVVANEALGLVGDVADLDEEVLLDNNYVKNFSDDENVDFGIVINGKDEGTVFAINGVEDRDGNTVYGTNLELPAE